MCTLGSDTCTQMSRLEILYKRWLIPRRRSGSGMCSPDLMGEGGRSISACYLYIYIIHTWSESETELGIASKFYFARTAAAVLHNYIVDLETCRAW